jgi:hypothetical protein
MLIQDSLTFSMRINFTLIDYICLFYSECSLLLPHWKINFDIQGAEKTQLLYIS